jgi:putative hydrolase of the HAD superfamily
VNRLAPPSSIKPDAAFAAFARIDTWVFDLDNTLYPAGSDLWPKIDARITLFLANLFGIDGLSARALQKYYYHRYGTTLRGLMLEQEVGAAAFLAFVHDIDRSSITRNELLGAAIATLPGRKLILTNGSREHALRTTAALGLDTLFEDIFDIEAADFLPKPEPDTYQRFFDKHAIDPSRAAMFEDLAKNLVVPHARGMTTVLVAPKPGEGDHRDPLEMVSGVVPAHIDFVTSDLEGFLETVIATASPPHIGPQPAAAGSGVGAEHRLGPDEGVEFGG